jgi:hypothetical protein
MFTSSQTNVLRAMKIRKILGITPVAADLNKSHANILRPAVSMWPAWKHRRCVPGDPRCSLGGHLLFHQEEVPRACGIRCHLHPRISPPAALGIVAAAEQDLGFPVVPLTTAPIWQTQRRRHLRQPIKDYRTVGNCASVARPDGFGRIWSRRDGRAPLCRGLSGPLPCAAASVGLRYEPRHGSGGMLPARTRSSS